MFLLRVAIFVILITLWTQHRECGHTGKKLCPLSTCGKVEMLILFPATHFKNILIVVKELLFSLFVCNNDSLFCKLQGRDLWGLVWYSFSQRISTRMARLCLMEAGPSWRRLYRMKIYFSYMMGHLAGYFVNNRSREAHRGGMLNTEPVCLFI